MKQLLAIALAILTATTGCVAGTRAIPCNPSFAFCTNPFAHEPTLATIAHGAYHSARDKNGAEGTVITIHNVTVDDARDESDGDTHLYLHDATAPRLVAEITPHEEPQLQMPARGDVIAITGIPYCDHEHEHEAWHGNTCWEIHPVMSWENERP